MDVIVAVALLTYNGQEHIKEQLDSILQQTRRPNMLYIVDDHSSDNTIKLIKEYGHRFEAVGVGFRVATSCIERSSLMTVYSRLKYNLASAFSELKDVDLVFLCDQDDIWGRQKIESYVYFYQHKLRSDQDVCDKGIVLYSDYHSFSCDREFSLQLNPVRAKCGLMSIMKSNVAPGMSIALDRKAQSMFLANVEYIYYHDWGAALIVAANSGRVIYVPRASGIIFNMYRQHSSNVLGEIGLIQKNFRFYVCRIFTIFLNVILVARVKLFA